MEDIDRIHMRAIRVVCKLPMITSADEIKKMRQWNPISLYYVNLRSFKFGLKANKHLLNSINFARGSCCVSMKNNDFLYF